MNVLGMGPLEILLILLLAFIVLGPERMVDAGRLLGKATREARKLSEGLSELSLDEEPPRPSRSPRASLDSSADDSKDTVKTDGVEAGRAAGNDGPVEFQAPDPKEADDQAEPPQQRQEKA